MQADGSTCVKERLKSRYDGWKFATICGYSEPDPSTILPEDITPGQLQDPHNPAHWLPAGATQGTALNKCDSYQMPAACQQTGGATTLSSNAVKRLQQNT